MSKPEVLVVHCVDTEGIFYEILEATFKRIKDVYHFDIKPSQANLEALRNNSYPGVEVNEEMKKFISKKQLGFINTLDQHRTMIMDLMQNYRFKLLDSYRKGYIWNWHILDFVGFKTNPRKRLDEDHVLFDLFNEYISHVNIKVEVNDILQWHYHHPPIDGEGTRTGLNWYYNNMYDYILSRKIIDRLWFPCVFRPGEHYERNDISFWLNQWIPFDYASRSVDQVYGYNQIDDDGRRHDWTEAQTNWGVYHPDYENYQKPGKMRRSIARILDIKSRAFSITEYEVEKAFKQVKEKKKSTILAVMNHDFRDMRDEHDHFISLLKKVSSSYPNIPFRYCDGVNAMRRYYSMEHKNPLKIDISYDKPNKIFIITLDNEPFGKQPYFCFEIKSHKYFHEPLYKVGNETWAYYINFNPDTIKNIGVACNDDTGNTTVCKYNPAKNDLQTKTYSFEEKRK